MSEPIPFNGPKGPKPKGPKDKWGPSNPPMSYYYQYEPTQPKPEPKQKPSILTNADELINGDRAKQYGSAKEQYEAVAAVWSALVGKTITAEQAALMMAAMKVVRAFQQMPENGLDDMEKPYDSVLDLAGYAGVVEKILKERGWW